MSRSSEFSRIACDVPPSRRSSSTNCSWGGPRSGASSAREGRARRRQTVRRAEAGCRREACDIVPRRCLPPCCSRNCVRTIHEFPHRELECRNQGLHRADAALLHAALSPGNCTAQTSTVSPSRREWRERGRACTGKRQTEKAHGRPAPTAVRKPGIRDACQSHGFSAEVLPPGSARRRRTSVRSDPRNMDGTTAGGRGGRSPAVRRFGHCKELEGASIAASMVTMIGPGGGFVYRSRSGAEGGTVTR